MSEEDPNRCGSCFGTGEAPTDHGVVDCPDCGGSGTLPPRHVLVEWRVADIERALQSGGPLPAEHGRWMLAELRRARAALSEVHALAHDAPDTEGVAIGFQIRTVSGRALGLYPMGPPISGSREAGEASSSEA